MARGAWVFAVPRVPRSALFEILARGATICDFDAWFPGVDKQQARTVLEFQGRMLGKALAY